MQPVGFGQKLNNTSEAIISAISTLQHPVSNNEIVIRAILERSSWDIRPDNTAVLCIDAEVADLIAIDAVACSLAVWLVKSTGLTLTAVRFPKRLRRYYQ